MAAAKTGRQAILEQFLADGMNVMFGNPGTVEQGFLDALKDYPELKYVLTLQESIAVLAGDGYARATQRPTLVQLHSSPGIGNAVGAAYQAMRGHAPLVIIGADAGLKYMNLDAQMAADLVAMMEPVTKYSTMVLDPANLLRTLRRAIKIAATPPMGPVYICLPADILDAECVEPVRPTSIPSTRVAPAPELVAQAAEWLAAAETPMIFIGDGVAYSGAAEELGRVAELLGAEVWEADAGEVNLPYDHPCYKGMTGHMFGFASLPILSKGDANLVVGTYIVPEVFAHLGDVWKEGAKTVHFDLNAYEIAKNHPVDLGVVADPKLALAALADALESILTDEQRAAAKARVEAFVAARAEKRAAELAKDEAEKDAVPMHMARFMSELAERLPEDAIIFDEALTSSPAVVRYFTPRETGGYFLTRGGSLGIGIPGAIGAKLANPERTVVGFTGDGGSLYTIQALWTAARHDIAAKFVICNNGSYRLLQLNIDQYWKEQGIEKHDYPLSFDLSYPPIGFVDIARGFGVPALRVEKPHEIAKAIEQMLAAPGPFLIDLALEGNVHPERVGNTCGQ
jgi:Thiamine pyrophosphate-requiring enzymes [acetolactate synthase, pyruvate dehydrogenase (cytochrome), glyoxylate carboligase, phosphonopyruvate decarboxylase]